MLRKVKNIGKKAVKLKFVASLSRLDVQGTKAWQPYKLVVAWTRRKKHVTASAQSWRPSIEVPYKGHVTWSGQNQETLAIQVTLFQDAHMTGYEPKYWVVVLQNEARDGKRKAIATVRLDMADYVMEVPSPRQIELQFKPLTRKVASASLVLTLTCDFLSIGPATESDLMSVAGSTTSEDTIRLGDIDVADVGDFDDRDFSSSRSDSVDGRSKDSFSTTQQELRNLTNQIESLIDSPPIANGQDVDAGDEQNESVVSGTSRKSSFASERSGRTSSNNKASPDARKSISEEDVEEDDVGGSSNRDSIISDSSDSSLQKRRLRPSVDFLPSHKPQEESPSSLLGSPAPHVQKSLLRWCQKVTVHHRGVKVTNFTTSWRNGLALCAILHHHIPTLIDYDNMNGLDARKNCRKAIEGCESLHMQGWEKVDASIISDKNKLITLLLLLKNHFEEELQEKDANASGDSPVSSAPSTTISPVHKTKSSNPAFLGVSNTMRVQLLSDLEEKEYEDDVFSATVDDVLESQRTNGTCGGSSHLNSDSNDPEADVVEVPEKEQLLSCVHESPLPSPISIIPNASPHPALPIDIVLDSLRQEEDANDVDTNDGPKTSDPHPGSNPNLRDDSTMKDGLKKIEVNLVNHVSEDVVFTTKNKDLENIEPHNPFVEKTKEPLDKFFLQIELPASTSIPTSHNNHNVSDSLFENTSRVLICENGSNHLQEEVEMLSTDEHVIPPTSSKIDSLELTRSKYERRVDDGDFQTAVNKLLESSAARSKKAKTLELIEKAKAQVAVPGTEPMSEAEVKRQKDVKKRAKRLIEETRATLDRTRKRELPGDCVTLDQPSDNDEQGDVIDSIAPSSGVNPTMTATSLDESICFKPEISLSNGIVPCTSTPSSKSNVSSSEASDVGTKIPAPSSQEEDVVISVGGTSLEALHLDCPDSIREPTQADPSSLTSTEDPSSSASIENPSSSTSIEDPSSSTHNHDTSQQGHSDVIMRRKKLVTDAEVSLPHDNSSASSSYLRQLVSSSSHPLSNDTPTATAPLPTNGDAGFPHPLQNDTKSTTSHGSQSDVSTDPAPSINQSTCEDVLSSATMIERLSIASASDLQKRLSVVLRKKTASTSAANVANEIGRERLALDVEQRHVEERAEEVQLELQQLKTSGRRANKTKEADLMQEWFQLVNKKNAILRQQDQLTLMEEEQGIVERVEKIHEELIPLMAIEDSMKTQAQRDREHILLQEKVGLVNDRDRIMQDMNEKEQIALEEEEYLQTNLGENMSKVIQSEEKCSVM